ncbi:MAG: response regulator [Deltaproteobacteria bacterium]|nr:response regulator [Deltaproteobacteria bacterium]
MVEASSGEDGLALYSTRKDRIALVITDVIMPGIGGAKLAEALQTRDPGVKVLFVSGYTDDMVGEQGILGPEVKLVNKPLEEIPFLKTVATIIRSRIAAAGK